MEDGIGSKLAGFGDVLLTIGACAVAVFLIIVCISEFIGVYPPWYDYQDWYPSIAGGYEGTQANISLGFWTFALVIALASRIWAFRHRGISLGPIWTAFATILLIFGILITPDSSILFWGVSTVIAFYLGIILVGFGEREPSIPPTLKKSHLRVLPLGFVGIGAIASVILAIRGFTATTECVIAPLSRRIFAGMTLLLCFGLCIGGAFLIWKRSRMIYTITVLAPVLPLSLLPPFLVWMPELMGLSLLLLWVPLILATALVVTYDRGESH
ncbi:hypothetical protein AKJ63_00635 [candidate division MSBL1 archaeon SCGC-AAA259D18]|uniref:DUF998 domain-containing protein n=1 Tax=candidate division MSBL1 archaeon SCGC-AAA259D18 TaxID=1698262 RepID=A0A133UCB9_9EURY|nr:hypothetical protein AKJ63_00635 [candidate division MSBL1 archaeon SCGC-AAA259D18]